jgi:hypothetical protein
MWYKIGDNGKWKKVKASGDKPPKPVNVKINPGQSIYLNMITGRLDPERFDNITFKAKAPNAKVKARNADSSVPAGCVAIDITMGSDRVDLAYLQYKITGGEWTQATESSAEKATIIIPAKEKDRLLLRYNGNGFTGIFSGDELKDKSIKKSVKIGKKHIA